MPKGDGKENNYYKTNVSEPSDDAIQTQNDPVTIWKDRRD